MEIQKIEMSKDLLLASQTTKNKKEKKQKMNVLDEDSYVESLEKIITKDFFPDLAKLHAQAEYFDAVERKDTQKLWEIQRKYTRPRTGLVTPSVFSTPSTFETPEGRAVTTPLALNKDPHSSVETPVDRGERVEGRTDQDEQPTHNPEPGDSLKGVGLDRFLAKNTSEDNVSFAEIMKEAEKKHRNKHAWLFEKEQQQLEEQKEFLALPSIEQQAIQSTSKDLQTWTYVPNNAVMYVPDSAPESAQERIERIAAKPREIKHKNTRFTVDPFNQEKSKETISQAASSQALLMQGKIGADGKEILPSQSPQVGGYGFVATPSPAPGIDASPLMTWGEIEGTPFRLDGGDTPIINGTPGSVFKVPDVPRRDRLLHELAEKASKAHRAKKQEAIKQCQASFSRTSSPSTPKTDRLMFLSPAAQRLVSKKFGVRPNTDKALKASYTPSPGRRPVGDGTPTTSPAGTPNSASNTQTSSKTPKSGSGTPKTGATPKLSITPKRKAQRASITDDLLQLPKRPKAQEFF